MTPKAPTSAISIGGVQVFPGERKEIQLDVARLYDFTEMNIPVEVVRGKEPGPSLFVSAAIHGDEINGVEIIRRLLKRVSTKKLRGTLIAVPVVNIFGFNNRSRYLPDRRDLNRCFPGSKKGSLASRIARAFMQEIVAHCNYGIDLHTAAIHRTNLPQIRASMNSARTKKIAEAFGAPVILNAQIRDGSLRDAATKKGVAMLLFEGGEALRYDEPVIKMGVKGCVAVMRDIGMLRPLATSKAPTPAFHAKDSFWIRAPHSGSLRFHKTIGDRVYKGDVLAIVQDIFGKTIVEVVTDEDGIVIGKLQFPLVNKGDAIFHVATFKNLGKISRYFKTNELDYIM